MKPSLIKEAIAKREWWVPSNFKYFMLKGIAYTHKEDLAKKFNNGELLFDRNHETIHVRQAENLKDSWLRFYFEYAWEWIYNLPLVFVTWRAAYKFMPMELEAYSFQEDNSYNDIGKVWRDIKKKISRKERKRLARLWYDGDRSQWKWSFTEFCKDKVISQL